MQSRQTPEVVALVLLFLTITLFTVLGFGLIDWLPPVASEHGVGVDGVIQYLLYTTGAILIIGAAAFMWFLWRFGRGKPTASPHTSARAERWWSLIPVILMALIAEVGVLMKGLPVWGQVYGTPPADALIIEVTGQQFEWIIRYPGKDGVFGEYDPHRLDNTTNPAGLVEDDPAAADDVVLRNRLHLPVGRPIALQLRARDVLHSFSIPAFRVKQDAVPGIVLITQFTATVPGEYEIACAELCGMGHYTMGGTVMVHTAGEFAAWLDQQKGWLQ